jgi:carboxyl-terminal processing protease
MILSILLLSISIAKTVPPEAPRSDAAKYREIELFQKVLGFVEKNYVEPVSSERLMQGAIRGMMDTLDPHSNYLPPEVFREMKIDTEGRFDGIGVEVSVKDGVLMVITPIEDSPAWRVGVKPGDRIVRINGESTKGLSISEAIQKMKGKTGTEVVLGVYRKGWKKFRDLKMKRESIQVKSVRSELIESKYGYVALSGFSENAAHDLDEAIKKLEKKKKLSGLVFDLRNNPGGLLDQAVEVASLFIDEGVVVSTIGRDPLDKEVRTAKGGKARKNLPVVILVNSGTASAAEIVSAALQDHHRAMILGETTFGKGSVQSVIPLGDDRGLKLTTAKYYSPAGRSIQEVGVVPDIALEDFDPYMLAKARVAKEIQREKDLKGHLKASKSEESAPSRESYTVDELSVPERERSSEPGNEDLRPIRMDPKTDYQIQQAIRYLKSFEVFRQLK